MDQRSKKWIEAAKTLCADPGAKVVCPECSVGTLFTKDEKFGEDKIDRYMICDTCKHHNVLTMSIDMLTKPNNK